MSKAVVLRSGEGAWRTHVVQDDIVCGYPVAGHEEEVILRRRRVDVAYLPFGYEGETWKVRCDECRH